METNHLTNITDDEIVNIIEAKSLSGKVTRKDFRDLLDRFGLQHKIIFSAMRKDVRYFNNDDETLDASELYYFKYLITNIVSKEIESRIKKYIKFAYNELNIKSEIISIWIVENKKSKDKFIKRSKLLNRTMHKYNFQQQNESEPTLFICYRDDVRSLEESSLMKFPLMKPVTIRLFGDEIKDHPAKRYKLHRNADYVSSGIIESLLRVPGTDPDFEFKGGETRHYFLLSFENRMDDANNIIVPLKNEKGGIINEGFTAEDQKKAEDLRDMILKESKHLISIAFHDDIQVSEWSNVLDDFEKNSKSTVAAQTA